MASVLTRWGGEEILELLEREFIYLWYYFDVQFRQIFWYWVMGMVLGSAVSVFLKDRIHGTFRTLGRKNWEYWVLRFPAHWELPRLFVCMARSLLRLPSPAAV